jgi:hypothetical protein
MSAGKPPQAVEYILQIMIFDIGCSRVQSIRSPCREVVDCLGALASCSANGGAAA